MIVCQSCIALLAALAMAAAPVSAHVDMIAPLAKVEKVYAAPKPLGKLSAIYVAPGEGKEQSLSVQCDLFRAEIPVQGLVDLPRPDWGSLSAAYSLTSFESGEWVERPYLYVIVPLHGPTGTSWQQTWATYHLDAAGKLTRRIKRFIPNAATKSIRVVWKDWEIGSGVTAEALLESAKDE